MTDLTTTTTYITENSFWAMIGIIITIFSAVIGALFIMQYNTNATVKTMASQIQQFADTLTMFMTDRKEKDQAYYKWRDDINEIKSQHNMMTNAKSIIARHNGET